MTAATPQASSQNRLGVNVFTAPGKAVVGERPRPFGEPLGWDPITSTLIYGEYDAVLVDTLTTVAQAEALADWVGLHHRNLTTIYVTHGHFDHFFGLSVLLNRFPGARAIATPKSVELMREQLECGVLDRFAGRWWPGQLAPQMIMAEPYADDTFTLEGHELRIIEQGRTDTVDTTSLHSKRYLEDFGRLQQSTTTDEELFNEMTKRYPDWDSNQSWLMFGVPSFPNSTED
jgi:ribonuclease BN (tRNA processing enzyme)